MARKGTSGESRKRHARLVEGYPKRDPRSGRVRVDKSTRSSRARAQDASSMRDKSDQLRKLRSQAY